MIAIIDYGAGNIKSVENALKRLGAEYVVTSKKSEILMADRLILPGVGDASYAMEQLRESCLDLTIKEVSKPLLGICLGMQLLCSHSEEGDVACLGILPNKVKKLQSDQINKVPNIGWSQVGSIKSSLFDKVKEGDYLYFVHSYGVEVNQFTIATSFHSSPFSAALSKDNFYGCQFHPEKSGELGEQILRNFLKI